MSEKKTELLYITNPGCGWCKKADPVVEAMRKEGYMITTLDMSKPEEATKANEIKAKFNASCGTPLFLDSSDGNMVCGFNEANLKKWADGEKIPPPPPRPQQPQQQKPQQAQGSQLEVAEFKMGVWESAKQTLMDKFYNDYEVWNNWNFEGNDMIGDCPVEERPQVPTADNIRQEAAKIMQFFGRM